MEATLFVLYMPKSPKATWQYKRMPRSWESFGAGGTPDPELPREEQFQGPRSSVESMRRYLKSEFDALKRQKVIKRYAIRSTALREPKPRASKRAPSESSCSSSAESSSTGSYSDSDWSED